MGHIDITPSTKSTYLSKTFQSLIPATTIHCTTHSTLTKHTRFPGAVNLAPVTITPDSIKNNSAVKPVSDRKTNIEKKKAQGRKIEGHNCKNKGKNMV